MSRFIRGCGIALALGGALLVLVNVVLTPLLPSQSDDSVIRLSAIYFFRISVSGVATLLLVFGCIGLHFAQRSVAGLFGLFAFLLTFLGNCLLFSVEWANLFVLRPVAGASPEVLAAIDQSTLMTTGFALAAIAFALGWLMFSISLWRARVLPRRASLMVLAGLVLTPVLGATPLGLAGVIAGNALFGAGLIGLGLALVRMEA